MSYRTTGKEKVAVQEARHRKEGQKMREEWWIDSIYDEDIDDNTARKLERAKVYDKEHKKNNRRECPDCGALPGEEHGC